MSRLILPGILSALFFSSTFVLNRSMSLEGGHWFWTASLRFGYMLLFLGSYTLCTGGTGRLREILTVYCRHLWFWTAAGSIGFGLFYSLLCFSAAYAPGWIIATSWQTTILATPLVLMAFGRNVPLKGIFLSVLIFAGIMLVNIEQAARSTLHEVALGFFPVLIAAFSYPVGNQMVWEASQRGFKLIPRIDDPVMEDSFARVMLLTLGSVPFWLLLPLLISPPPPSSGQWVSTALVALLSGVIATTIFLFARHRCRHPYELAAVDATQSMEVVFSLLGEILFLHGAFPGSLGLAGIILTIIGLLVYTRQNYAG